MRFAELADRKDHDRLFSALHLKCGRLFSAEDSDEYEPENIRVADCKFITDAELKIDRRNGKEFKFENVVIRPESKCQDNTSTV